ncbi:MAG: NADH-quinone oxidoreductase subunit M, partial [Actinobacteria bacterium]
MLSIIVFLPLAAAALCALLPKSAAGFAKWIAVAATAVDFGLICWLTSQYRPGGGMQFTEKFAWVPQVGIEYHLGVDGISLPMLFLSGLMTLIAVLASLKMDRQPKFWFAMVLLLQVGMNGVFVALDFVLFYVFWELVLVPMYFLIAQWGGERREYAAIKFFLYTLLGSVLMLVGIIALYLAAHTFNMRELAVLGAQGKFTGAFATWVFLAFFVGFAVKVPVWPLHTWLPDAHVEAPTAASVLLAAVLLKMGTYGFLRVSLPILPDAWADWRWLIATLAVISILYGALVAFAQT